MTCTKDCRDCFYSTPQIYYICLNPNSTCDKECYKCCYRGEVKTNYICKKEKVNEL